MQFGQKSVEHIVELNEQMSLKIVLFEITKNDFSIQTKLHY